MPQKDTIREALKTATRKDRKGSIFSFNAKAAETSQYYSGIFWNSQLGSMNVNFSVETASWQYDVDLGKGTSYGMETSANIQGKRLHATAAYTLSKTDRTFPNINSGKTYPFKFDRRHVLNRHNPYNFFFEDDEWRQVSVFPIMPSVRWTISW